MGNKFFKQILATALTLSLITVPMITPLTVYADGEYNDDGKDGDSNKVKGEGKGGVKADKTGVLFYCLDSENGEILNREGSDSDQGVVLAYSPSDITPKEIVGKAKSPNLTKKDYYANGILGDELGDYKYDMPKLFTWEGDHFESHYSDWNSWFESSVTDPETGKQMVMGSYLIKRFFPAQWNRAEAAKSKGEEVNISLLAEPVAWHSLFKTGSGDSAYKGPYMLTPAGWVEAKEKEGIGDSKVTFTDSFDKGILAWTMRLERIQFGWWTFGPAMKSSGKLTNQEITQNGYGVNIYNLDMTPGYSIVTPTPAPANVESETPTNYSVIKVYERENPETKEIVSEGSYITTNAYSDLTVNEEEGWKIISVETVSPQIKTIGSNDVYEVVKGDTTTKQVYDPDSLPVSVTLSPTEPTLIVRYRATGLELPPVRLTGLISKFC